MSPIGFYCQATRFFPLVKFFTVTVDLRFCTAALRSVWNVVKSTQPTPPSLRDALLARSDAQFLVVGAGSIKSVSANGQHVVNSDGGNGGQQVSAAEALSVWVYLVEVFDRAIGDLQSGVNCTAPIASPTDTQVEAQMESYLRPILGYTSNWMYLAK